MDITTYIQSVCRIRNGRVSVDGSTVFESANTDADVFLKEAFRSLSVTYPKFFKMDVLSRLAFIGAELLMKENPERDTALLFSNRSSSLDTDLSHVKSISDRSNYYPSPAVFVYTLPNISLGEISIRHQLKTENSFFIFDRFNPEFMAQYANVLLNSGRAQCVLCGWVELFGAQYEGFFYLVGNDGKMIHSAQQLTELYNL